MITYRVLSTGEICLKLDKFQTQTLLGMIDRANRNHDNQKAIDKFVSSCLHEATSPTSFGPRTLN